MPTVSEIQTCINNLTINSDPAEFAILATQANRETSNNLSFTMATVADLPDLVTTNIPNGQIVFVASLGVPVVARIYLYEWLSMDGKLIRKDGVAYVLYTWGANGSGQLGDGTTVSRSSPSTTAGRGTNWCQISAGYHAAAIKTDGSAWTWGCNNCGQLGNNSVANTSSPGTVLGNSNTWCQINAGSYHTAAVKTDGSAWTWGLNTSGQLGDNTAVNKSSPVAVTHASGNTCWRQISAGGSHTAAVKLDGTTWTAWTWGRNDVGQLGDNTTVSKSSPVAVTHADGNILWCQIDASGRNTAAVKTNGTAWTWGCNSSCQLGDNTTISRSSPVAVAGLNEFWCQITTGNQSSAIKTDGSAWTWGLNNSGQLGNNTVAARSTPVAPAGVNILWCAIDSSGSTQTAALKTDGTAWTWGNNAEGRLGDGTATNRSSPGLVAGNITWCAISSGCNFMMGIQAI